MFKKLRQSLADSVVDAVDRMETVGNRLSSSAASSVTGSQVGVDTPAHKRPDVTNSRSNDSLNTTAGNMNSSHYLTPNTTMNNDSQSDLSMNSPAILMSNTPNRMPRSRNDSMSSMASDFSISAGPSHSLQTLREYALPSDAESECNDDISLRNTPNLSKQELARICVKNANKVEKYRSKFTRMIVIFREVEDDRDKLRLNLTKTQDKAFRRISELKEQHKLDQQAKVHIEENYALMMDEKLNHIQVLQTQVELLKDGKLIPEELKQRQVAAIAKAQAVKASSPELAEPQLQIYKDKIKRLEVLLNKCKDTIKANKDNQKQLISERDTLNKKLVESVTQLDKLQTDHTSITAELQSRLTIVTNDLEVRQLEIASTKQQMHSTLNSNNDDLMNSKSLIAKLKMENETLQKIGGQQLDKSRSVIHTLQTECDQLQNDMQTRIDLEARRLEDERENEIAELNRGKVEALRLMQKQMEASISAASLKVTTESEEEIAALSTSHRLELEEVKREYDAQIHDLREKGVASPDSQNGLEASLTTEQKDHYANLEQQYTDKLEELAHEQEQHRTALESQDFRLNELFAEKYSHLEASLDASKDEARQLNEQLADVQRSLQTYEQQQKRDKEERVEMETNQQEVMRQAIEVIKEEHLQTLSTIDKQRKNEIDSLNESYTEQLSNKDNDITTTLETSFNTDKQAMQTEHQHALAEIQRTHTVELDAMNQRLTAKVEEYKDHTGKLDEEKRALTMELDAKIAELLEESKQYHGQECDTNDKLRSLYDENKTTKLELQKSEQELTVLRENITSLEESIVLKETESSDHKQTAGQQTTEMSAQIDELRSTVRDSETALSQKTEAGAKLDADLVTSREEVSSLADRLYARTEELSELRVELTAARKEIALTADRFAEQNDATSEMRGEIDVLRSTETDIATRVDDTRAQCERALDEAERSRVRQVDGLTAQLTANSGQLDAVVGELEASRSRLSEFERSADEVEGKVALLVDEVNALKAGAATLREETDSLNAVVAERDSKVADLSTTLTSLGERLTTSRNEVTMLEGKLEHSERQTSEIRDIGSRDKDDALREMMLRVDKSNGDMRTAVEQLQVAKQHFRAEHSSDCEKLATYMSEIELSKEKELSVAENHKLVLKDLHTSLNNEINNTKMKEEEFIKELDEQRNASVETEKQNKFDLDLIIDSIKLDCQAEVKVLNNRLDSERENMTLFKENVKKQFDVNHAKTKETITKLKERFTETSKDNRIIAERQQEKLLVDKTKEHDKKIKQLTTKLEEAQLKKDTASEEARLVSAKVADVNADLGEQLSRLSDRYDASQSRIAELCAEADQRVSEKEEQIAALVLTADDREATLRDAECRLKTAQEDNEAICSESDARLAAVSVETERLRVDVTAAQSKVNVGVATLTSCREELVEARDHLTASKETNQTNAKLASDKISTLKLKYGAKLKQKQATYDEEVEKMNQRLSDNGDIITELSARLDSTTHSLSDTEKLLDVSQTESKDLTTSISTLQLDLEQTQHRALTLDDEVRTLQRNSEEREADVSLQRHRTISDSRESINKLELQLEEVKTYEHSAKLSLDDAKQEILNKDELYNINMDTIKKDHLELISNLEQQLEEANSRVSTTNVDIKHKEVKLKTLITSLKKDKKQLCNQISEFETRELERSKDDDNVERRISEAQQEFDERIDDMQRDNDSKIKTMLKTLNQEIREKDLKHEEELKDISDATSKDEARFIVEHRETLKELNSDINVRDEKIDTIEESYEIRIRDIEDDNTKKQKQYETTINCLRREMLAASNSMQEEMGLRVEETVNDRISQQDKQVLARLEDALGKGDKLSAFMEWLKERVVELSRDMQDVHLKHRLTIAENLTDKQVSTLPDEPLVTSPGNTRFGIFTDEDVTPNNDQHDEITELKSECRSLQVEVVKQTGEVAKLKISERELKYTISDMNSPATLQLNSETLLGESTEIEYLRNVLYEYMTGRETRTLSKVIMTVLNFSNDQKRRVDEILQSRPQVY